MAKEIERKFLVTSDAWRSEVIKSKSLQQAYICTMDDRNLRIRITDDNEAKITIKVGKSSLNRSEFEYPVPVEDAHELLKLAVGYCLTKTRNIVTYEGYTWEIDEFNGHYEGLIVAEVELESEADQPPLPQWIGREVTHAREYSNQSMATSDLRARLIPK